MPVIDLGSVVGPQGPQGATGATGAQGIQGNPGPNQVTDQTSTNLNGVLFGNQSRVTVKPVDASPTADSTNLVSSGGTDKAIKGRVPVYGMGKNLLDNWYFLNPVNQRGQTSGATGYSIDRWNASYGSGGVSWSLTSSGLTFQPTNTNSYAYISQVIGNEILSALTGKRISVYVLTSDGYVIGGVATYTSDVSIYDANYGGHRVRIRFVGSEIRIESYASALTVCAVKLELGSEQTLCHNEGTEANPVWVLNDVPDYEYELYRCMTSTADPNDTFANKTLATGQELAYVENGTTASRAYAVGEYFCWHGLLYRAKTAISNGATFTVNTNCEQVTEGALNSFRTTTPTLTAGSKFEFMWNETVQIGKLVIVELRVKATSSTTPQDALVSGLPLPKASTRGNSWVCMLGSNRNGDIFAVTDRGFIHGSASFSTDQSVVLSGVYYAE